MILLLLVLLILELVGCWALLHLLGYNRMLLLRDVATMVWVLLWVQSGMVVPACILLVGLAVGTRIGGWLWLLVDTPIELLLHGASLLMISPVLLLMLLLLLGGEACRLKAMGRSVSAVWGHLGASCSYCHAAWLGLAAHGVSVLRHDAVMIHVLPSCHLLLLLLLLHYGGVARAAGLDRLSLNHAWPVR